MGEVGKAEKSRTQGIFGWSESLKLMRGLKKLMRELKNEKRWLRLGMAATASLIVAAFSLLIESLVVGDAGGFSRSWLFVLLLVGAIVFWFLDSIYQNVLKHDGTVYYVRVQNLVNGQWHKDFVASRSDKMEDRKIIDSCYWGDAGGAAEFIDARDAVADVVDEFRRCSNDDVEGTGFEIIPDMAWPAGIAFGFMARMRPSTMLREASFDDSDGRHGLWDPEKAIVDLNKIVDCSGSQEGRPDWLNTGGPVDFLQLKMRLESAGMGEGRGFGDGSEMFDHLDQIQCPSIIHILIDLGKPVNSDFRLSPGPDDISFRIHREDVGNIDLASKGSVYAASVVYWIYWILHAVDQFESKRKCKVEVRVYARMPKTMSVAVGLGLSSLPYGCVGEKPELRRGQLSRFWQRCVLMNYDQATHKYVPMVVHPAQVIGGDGKPERADKSQSRTEEG